MPASWPLTLPQHFMLSGNQQSIAETRLRSNMDIGPPKMRPRSSANVQSFSAGMRMNAAQWAALMTFGIETLGKWTLPFTIASPSEDGTWLVRFATLPSRVAIGNDRWNVSISLEILP